MFTSCDQSLLTTFHTNGTCERFIAVDSLDELRAVYEAARHLNLPVYVLGAGSNTLMTSLVKTIVMKMQHAGVTIETLPTHHRVTVGAGMMWDELLNQLIEADVPGLENLTAIPGSVGGGIVQNLGAYGVEIGPFVETVTVYDPKEDKLLTLTGEAMQFGYRDSLLKRPEYQHYVIWDVVLKLPLREQWRPSTCYRAIQEYMAVAGLDESRLTPRLMQLVVRAIRDHKLPDPQRLGNAGSFFTNPVVDESTWKRLIETFPDLVWYDVEPGKKKLSAASLIEGAGLKGYQEGKVGVYPHHALVIVNYGGATGEAILALQAKIEKAVWDKYGVQLTREPVLV